MHWLVAWPLGKVTACCQLWLENCGEIKSLIRNQPKADFNFLAFTTRNENMRRVQPFAGSGKCMGKQAGKKTLSGVRKSLTNTSFLGCLFELNFKKDHIFSRLINRVMYTAKLTTKIT